jgi:hypothetical protein
VCGDLVPVPITALVDAECPIEYGGVLTLQTVELVKALYALGSTASTLLRLLIWVGVRGAASYALISGRVVAHVT